MTATKAGVLHKASQWATLMLAACAVVLTGLVIRREFAAKSRTSRPQPAVRLAPIHADSLAHGGRLIGLSDAPIAAVEFSDFQCPFCAEAAESLRAVLKKRPESVRLVYRHLPIEGIHRFALEAAVASECAAEQGRFAEQHDVMFTRQDSIGLIPWTSLALRAGVSDASAFSSCMLRDSIVSRVRADVALARSLGIDGTPAIFYWRSVDHGSSWC